VAHANCEQRFYWPFILCHAVSEAPLPILNGTSTLPTGSVGLQRIKLAMVTIDAQVWLKTTLA